MENVYKVYEQRGANKVLYATAAIRSVAENLKKRLNAQHPDRVYIIRQEKETNNEPY